MSMKSWRYVAARNADEHGTISWNVRELHESEPGDPPVYTANGMQPFGESLQELRRDLRMMYTDVLRDDLPILDLAGGEPAVVRPIQHGADSETAPGNPGGLPSAEEQASLRRLRMSDAADVLSAFASHADMERQGTVATLEDAERYIAALLEPGSHCYPWAIVVQDRLVGLVCVNVDVRNRNGWFWYWIHGESRGRGWASRAAAGVANWALTELELERLELGHRINNPASGGVARAAGFVREGTERAKFLVDGERIDVATYGRLATDPWPSMAGLTLRGDA